MGFIPNLTDISSFKCKLDDFSVLLKGQVPTNSGSTFEFIQNQSESLKRMKLVGFSTAGFIEFAINEMKFKTLEIDFTKIHGDLDEMKENFTINRIMAQFTPKNIPNVMKVIEKCKKCKDLKVVSNSVENFNDWMEKISKSMENLREFEIDSCLGENLPDISFKNLKVLKVSKISCDKQAGAWLELASKCPKVIIEN